MLRLIDRYIGRELLTAAFFAVSTLSFVLVLGQIFKRVFELIFDHNIPATYIITFIAYFLPLSLIFSIPWGFLTAVLLVFGRLSASNELTALRTAGVSILRVARPVLLASVAFSALCLWINLYVAPRAQQDLRNAFFNVATSNPAAAFGGDQVIDQFPGYKMYVGRAEGKHLESIFAFKLNSENQATEVVFAHKGSLDVDTANHQIKMRLEETRYEARDLDQPADLTKIHDGNLIGDFVYPLSLEELYVKKAGRRRVESFTLEELSGDLAKKRAKLARDEQRLHESPSALIKRDIRNDKSSVAEARTELNKRFSFSMACMTFALIGIPLGITAHRQETSVGFGLSLIVAFTYFLIIIVVNAVRARASLHPELLIWLPNIIFLLLGGGLFFRLTRR